MALYDLERGEKINTYYNKNYGVDLVRFTHHNKCILCASKRDSHYRIMYWSLHDNNILCSFIGHTDSITAIDLNPSDSSFLSCSKDGTTRVWEYQKKQCLIKFNKSRTACFDNMGKLLACLFVKAGSGGYNDQQEGGAQSLDQMIHLFNTENYKDKPFATFTIENETKEIKSMKFSPNGKYVLLGTR